MKTSILVILGPDACRGAGERCRWLWKECDSLRQNSQSHESFGRIFWWFWVGKKRGKAAGCRAEDEVEWDICVYWNRYGIADRMLYVNPYFMNHTKYRFISFSVFGSVILPNWHFLTTYPSLFTSLLPQEISSTQPMAFKKSWALAILSWTLRVHQAWFS